MTGVFKRRLPWLCGCHDPAVFGHVRPCIRWESGIAQPWQSGGELPPEEHGPPR
jgi:hypothetical protein